MVLGAEILQTKYIWKTQREAACMQKKLVTFTGLPQSGKKFWKMKKIPGQGKVRELHFQSGKFKKMKKVLEKSGNFKIFLKRC